MSNAVKFTDRGAIAIRLERRLNGSQPPELRFSVTDTGIGIAADKHHVVFEEFTQIDGSMSRRYVAVCTLVTRGPTPRTSQ